VASLQVRPRPTPGEHDGVVMDVDVDEDLAVLAASLEDWVTPRPGWELMLRQGTEFDRRNNVEAELELALGEQTSRLLFRLDQLEAADDTPEELVLRFEERDGIAKLAHSTGTGWTSSSSISSPLHRRRTAAASFADPSHTGAFSRATLESGWRRGVAP
jgi:hypothetical protein